MLWTHQQLVAALLSAVSLLISPADPFREGAPKTAITKTQSLRSTNPVPVNRKLPVIYLSFDDGPCEGSLYVNDIATRNNIPINVFLIGATAVATQKSHSLIKLYEGNHLVEIGNHSYSHAHRRYKEFFSDPQGVLADIDLNSDSLHLTNKMVRLPGRNFFRLGDQYSRDDHNNGIEAADTLSAHGYQVFGWDIEWRRQAEKGIATHTASEMLALVTRMLDNQKTFLPSQIIILLHDRDLQDTSFRAEINNFVSLVQSDGNYRFAHLSEYTSPTPPAIDTTQTLSARFTTPLPTSHTSSSHPQE